MGLLFVGTQIFSSAHDYWDDIPDSARRMAMFFVPLMIFYVSLVAGELGVFEKRK